MQGINPAHIIFDEFNTGLPKERLAALEAQLVDEYLWLDASEGDARAIKAVEAILGSSEGWVVIGRWVDNTMYEEDGKWECGGVDRVLLVRTVVLSHAKDVWRRDSQSKLTYRPFAGLVQ